MTIEIIRPETEALIQRCLESGEFVDVDKLLAEALGALTKRDLAARAAAADHSKPEGRKRLADLFAESPLKGLDIEFDEFEQETDFGSAETL